MLILTSTIDVKKIEPKTGLLAENLGSLRTTSTTWKIIYTLDLTPHLKIGDKLNKAIELYKEKCQKWCANDNRIQEMNEKVEEILKTLLEAINTISKKDKREAPLKIIGEIQRVLFGTLDEKAGKELANIVDHVHNDTRELAKLLSEQTEIVDLKLKEAKNDTKNITQRIQQIEYYQETYESTFKLQELYIDIENEITNYKIETEMLVEAIVLAQNGIVHPKILKSEELLNSIKIIKQARVDAELPIKEITPAKLAAISKLNILFTKNNLVYSLAVPLVDLIEFQLVDLHPFPIKQIMNNKTIFAYIWPESKYIALTINKEAYIPITVEQLLNCKKTDEEIIICENLEPLQEINRRTICEVKIITNREVNLTECDVRIKELKATHWIKMKAANTWVYTTPQEDFLYVNCPKVAPTTVDITGAGIIKLDSGCTAKSESARLTTSKIITSEVNILYDKTSNFNISIYLNTTDMFKQIKDVLEDNNIGESKSKSAKTLETGLELNEIIRKAKKLQEYKNLKNKFNNYTSQTWIYMIIIIAFGLVLIIICLGIILSMGGPCKLMRRIVTGTRPRTSEAQIQLQTITVPAVPTTSRRYNALDENWTSIESIRSAPMLTAPPTRLQLDYKPKKKTRSTGSLSTTSSKTWHQP